MIKVKNKEIKTADFEHEYNRVMRSVDDLKHSSDAAKEEVKQLLKSMYSVLVTYKKIDLEIAKCFNQRGE